jgi:hypothetical protein
MALTLIWVPVACHHTVRVPKEDDAAPGSRQEEPLAVQEMLVEAASSTELRLRELGLETLILTTERAGAGEWGPRGVWDPNFRIQLSTVRALGNRLHEPESRELLLTVVKREQVEPHVRCSAASLLGDAEARQLLPLIRMEYAGESSGRARISCALAGMELGDPEAEVSLLAGLQEDELPLDPFFIRSLGQRLSSEHVAALAQALEWAEEGFAMELAGAAAQLDIAAGWKILASSLASEDQLEGLESLDVLIGLPVSRRSTALLQEQRREGSLAGRGADMWLELQEGRHASLRRSWESEDRDLRVLAVEMATLALSSDAPARLARESRDLLSQALVDEAMVVRLAALRGLRLHANTAQLRALIRKLEHADESEQLEVAVAIRYRMAALNSTGTTGP